MNIWKFFFVLTTDLDWKIPQKNIQSENIKFFIQITFVFGIFFKQKELFSLCNAVKKELSLQGVFLKGGENFFPLFENELVTVCGAMFSKPCPLYT